MNINQMISNVDQILVKLRSRKPVNPNAIDAELFLNGIRIRNKKIINLNNGVIIFEGPHWRPDYIRYVKNEFHD